MPPSCVSTKPQKQPGAVADVVTKPPVEIEVDCSPVARTGTTLSGGYGGCLKGVRLDVIGW